jgi:LysM repeat protein
MAPRWIAFLLALVFGTAEAAWAKDSARTARTHVVASGQRLGSIAKRYQVSIAALCEANGISRRDPIRPGQRLLIPELGGEPSSSASSGETGAEDSTTLHRVESGQRLGSIARRYSVSIEAICKENSIQRNSTLRLGQLLRIPNARSGVDPSSTATSNAKTAYAKAPRRKGYVEFANYSRKFRGYVFDKRGRLLPAARTQIAGILGVGRDDPALDERLIRTLVEVSDHFGGRPVRIVSGYRTSSYFKGSRHKQSRAVDFSVPGVPNEVVRDYVRTFERTGVGYYPNSSFVHLDVREYSAYWVDYARPGEAPRRSPNRLANAEVELHDEEPNNPSSVLAPAPALDVAGARPTPPETLTAGMPGAVSPSLTGTIPARVLRPAPARALVRELSGATPAANSTQEPKGL